MKTSPVFAVILAGGQSSRLFPFNKVISDLTGSGRSLIQQACDRMGHLPRKQIYVLTVGDMVVPIHKQLRLASDHYFVDPVRRGTCPALLWAMAHLRQKDAGAVLAVVTGDQVIPKVREFQKAFQQAVQTAAEQAAFVVIPVQPSRIPKDWVGFGAVRAGTIPHPPLRYALSPGERVGVRDGERSLPIVGFEEKPSPERARQMLREGGWSWNAGMFFFRIGVAEEVLKIHQPAMSLLYQDLCEALAQKKLKRAARIFASFPAKIPHPLDSGRLVDNTVDYAVMTPLVYNAHPVASAWVARQPLTHWTDLGQWTALRQVAKPDRHGNIRVGDVRVGPGVRDSILAADRHHRIVVSGLKDQVVAFAQGKALILPLSDVVRIKEIVALFKGAGPLVGDRAALSSFVLKKSGAVAILSNRPKEAI